MGAIRQQDKAIFASAAHDLKLWILVRRTNTESLRYIGLPGYTPKPNDCKAKTADYSYDSRYQTAGLVVDPEVHKKAFSSRLSEALVEWEKFKSILGNPAAGFSVDRDSKSRHFGCVTVSRAETGGRAKYIHGDYDLYDLVPADNVRPTVALVSELRGQPHNRPLEFSKVQAYVNSRIGVPMIQHASQVHFMHHSDEPVEVFGPKGEEYTLLNQLSIEAMYKNQFQGRRTIMEKW